MEMFYSYVKYLFFNKKCTYTSDANFYTIQGLKFLSTFISMTYNLKEYVHNKDMGN